MHQLLQITCSARNRIVYHQILFPVIRIRHWNFTDSGTQMIYIAEILFHSQHKRGNKGFQLHRRGIHCRCRHQQAQYLCTEFPVEEQALLIGICLHETGHFASLAPEGMIRFSVIRLYLSAIFAYLKAFAYILNTGDIHLFAYCIAFAKVDLPKCRFTNEFISEREIFIVHTICTCDISVFIHINK